jgi:outer membrane protein OmpA-like peptidoglycan-associated protein/tetratricopeptide (TPR) repeat protein
MRINKFLIILIFAILSVTVFADDKPNTSKDVFWNAETFFYNKDYKEALTLYKTIYEGEEKNNANLNYRIGVCYLKGYNDLSEKVKAIQYLEKAVTSVSKDYKEGRISETNAPEDAYIYLGDSYLLANKLDDAIKAYNDFKTVSGTDDQYFLKIVDRKIETCKSAGVLKKLSVKYELKNYGKLINNQFANYNGVISAHGNVLAFTTDMKFYEAVMYSIKENGEFTMPKNFNIEAKVEGSIRSLSLSPDGKELYLFKKGNSVELTGDIYVSKWVDGKWSEIEKLNKNINTSDLEMHASVSQDDSVLYFTSNRKGGLGGLDIYKSQRQNDGTWGTAVNLGDKINTEFDEKSPFLVDVGEKLYFSSQGHHYNIGGNDFFVSKLDDNGSWTTPLNFGFPINTTDDNLFMFPISTDKAIIAMATDDGFGDLDLYELSFYPKDIPAILVKGKLDNKGKEILVSIKTNGETVEVKTDKNGSFEKEILSGNQSDTEFSAEDMENAKTSFTTPAVYCLAEVNVSDVELKHTEKEVVAETDNNNNDSNNNSSNKNLNITNVTINSILFGFNKDIPESNFSNLEKLAEYLNKVDNILIEIQGYADLQGDESYNIILSERRANYVKKYLISKGVNENKFEVKGYGEANQISIDLNPISRKYNRRVTFKVIRDSASKITFLEPNIPENYKIK